MEHRPSGEVTHVVQTAPDDSNSDADNIFGTAPAPPGAGVMPVYVEPTSLRDEPPTSSSAGSTGGLRGSSMGLIASDFSAQIADHMMQAVKNPVTKPSLSKGNGGRIPETSFPDSPAARSKLTGPPPTSGTKLDSISSGQSFHPFSASSSGTFQPQPLSQPVIGFGHLRTPGVQQQQQQAAEAGPSAAAQQQQPGRRNMVQPLNLTQQPKFAVNLPYNKQTGGPAQSQPAVQQAAAYHAYNYAQEHPRATPRGGTISSGTAAAAEAAAARLTPRDGARATPRGGEQQLGYNPNVERRVSKPGELQPRVSMGADILEDLTAAGAAHVRTTLGLGMDEGH